LPALAIAEVIFEESKGTTRPSRFLICSNMDEPSIGIRGE
jgi:hypothetical protein